MKRHSINTLLANRYEGLQIPIEMVSCLIRMFYDSGEKICQWPATVSGRVQPEVSRSYLTIATGPSGRKIQRELADLELFSFSTLEKKKNNLGS